MQINSLLAIQVAVAFVFCAPLHISAQDNAQAPSNGGQFGLAQSPWPKMLGNARNTGMNQIGSLRAAAGTPWLFETLGANRDVVGAPALDADGALYIGADGLYALDGATGATKWQQDIGAAIGTPAAVGANGLIYFGANDGTVYALRASDGLRAPRPRN